MHPGGHVIVSEETGTISVATGGILKRHLAPETLDKLLHNELCPADLQTQNESITTRVRNVLSGKHKEDGNEKK